MGLEPLVEFVYQIDPVAVDDHVVVADGFGQEVVKCLFIKMDLDLGAAQIGFLQVFLQFTSCNEVLFHQTAALKQSYRSFLDVTSEGNTQS